jgi:pyruvate dehydrogenase E1 component alpha subunit
MHCFTASLKAITYPSLRASLIEAKTYRFYNHHGVQNLGLKYRTDDEVAEAKLRDPIFTYEERLIEAGTMSRADVDAVWAQLNADIEDAIRFAEESPLPEPSEMMADIYTVTGAAR